MGLDSHHITGIILAGGRASRMGGKDKGLMTYHGKPLITHVIARFAAQVPQLAINANRHVPDYQAFGFPVFTDRDNRFAGPLAGVAAALAYAKSEWILTVPTDAPQLPPDLVARLCQNVTSTRIHVASCNGAWQPVFALWPRACLPALEAFLASDKRAAHEFLREQQAIGVDFSDQPRAFANINTPEQIQAAAVLCPVLGIVGWSGSGKTTLLKQLIPLLDQAGMRLGLIKHAHHQFDIDIPGKDSYELRKAGASQVLVTSQARWALMTETPRHHGDPSLTEMLTHLNHAQLDLILVEGFKHAHLAKIEVHRPALDKPVLCRDDTDIIAVASDTPNLPNMTVPRLDLNNPVQITGFIRKWVLDQSHTTSA
jgi:molybdenum cofactor guanylyltransferase/molybdopterin-guanine dinucleotide biosynthesis protein MobB